MRWFGKVEFCSETDMIQVLRFVCCVYVCLHGVLHYIGY